MCRLIPFICDHWKVVTALTACYITGYLCGKPQVVNEGRTEIIRLLGNVH